jgi:hypothetical protein
VHIHTPAAADSPLASLLTALYLDALREGLREALYAAARGDTGVSFGSLGFGSGLTVEASGFSPAVSEVLRDVLATAPRAPLSLAGVTPKVLASKLVGIVDDLRNAAVYQQPYQAGLYVHAMLNGQRRWSLQHMLLAAAALGGVEMDAASVQQALVGSADGTPPPSFVVADPQVVADAVGTHAERLFREASEAVVTVYGNENQATARDLALAALKALLSKEPGAPRPLPAAVTDSSAAAALACVPAPAGAFPRVATLPAGNSAYLARADNAAEPNDATVVMYQLGLRDACGVDTGLGPAAAWATNGTSRRALQHDHGASGQTHSPPIRGGGSGAITACAIAGAAADMLAQLIREPAFDDLRTQQQLGYIVFAVPRVAATALPPDGADSAQVPVLTGTPTGTGEHANGVDVARSSVAVRADIMQSLAVIVQGVAQPAHVMDAAVARFVADFASSLAALPADTWRAAVDSLRNAKLRPALNMDEAFSRALGEVAARTYRFDRAACDAAALEWLRPEDVAGLVQTALLGATRRRVAVDVFGAGHVPTPPTDGAAVSVPQHLLPTQGYHVARVCI